MNIKDIAQMAGVSRATVSRYLNNGYVSDEKKEKIRAIIEKTGYVPSTQAKMLRTKQTKLVGVIIPRLNSESVSRILEGIGSVLEDGGYHMLLANTDNHYEKELEYLKIFSNDRVDGVILLASALTRKHRELLAHMPVPVVIVGQEYLEKCCVFHDDKNAAAALTRCLLEKGCLRPVYLGVSEEDEAVGKRRREGFEIAVEEKGLLKASQIMGPCLFSAQSGYEQIRSLIAAGGDFDGVICATDTIGAGVLLALREAGLRVPEDVKVAGFGDSKLASLMTPSMTTVHYHYEESGKEAARMVMEQMEQGKDFAKSVMLGYEIVLRKSV